MSFSIDGNRQNFSGLMGAFSRLYVVALFTVVEVFMSALSNSHTFFFFLSHSCSSIRSVFVFFLILQL